MTLLCATKIASFNTLFSCSVQVVLFTHDATVTAQVMHIDDLVWCTVQEVQVTLELVPAQVVPTTNNAKGKARSTLEVIFHSIVQSNIRFVVNGKVYSYY